MVSPYVGMVFKSDDLAFEYFGKFARKNGFSVRKERSRLSPQLGVYKRDFVCYRSGFAPTRKKQTGEHQRDRKSVRCGCDAKMYLSKEVVDGVSQWFVVQFSNIHNHELLEDDQVRDVRNFIQNHKKVIQQNDALLMEKRENDARELLEACRASKEADPYFVYDVTIDEKDNVENIAWSYGDSVHAYDLFGDVVHFDLTYHSMTYGMLFGAWLGIDNYGKIIFFVLLQDESPRSYAWALQVFLRFMKGRNPQAIITDIDTGLGEAIRSELPNTKHVISLHSILPRISSWFCLPLGPRFREFRYEFEALYSLESTDDFEFRWNQMVSHLKLDSDKHIALLFTLRTSWAFPYVRGCFLAKMVSSTFWKSVDDFFHGVFEGQTCLRGIFEQVCLLYLEHTLISNYKLHAHVEPRCMHLKTCLPLEKHARSLLSPFAFKALQEELALAMQYAAAEMVPGSYLVRHFKKIEGERLVIWIPELEHIHCACNEFESSGILCRHALRVLVLKNYFQLPNKYFLGRWRRESSLNCHNEQSNLSFKDEWYEEFNSLTGTLFSEALLSKERSDFVHSELTKDLTRLITLVRDMPTVDEVVDVTLPPAQGS
ncbi:hypothetical protein F511_11605 [Dorcoceras hygrometricum]|uniref:Protein FAR1-RELATED SEQUENCE n=1 Tax=Dorcoceras hygrometricum TaxID=472368 RepID=A0A2Z7AZW8_9LAMI|nr:hypothetical protein F511_11605 [Dorcoceras hygrometricum]